MQRIRLVSFLGLGPPKAPPPYYEKVKYRLGESRPVETFLLDKAICEWFAKVEGQVLLGTKEVEERWVKSGLYAGEVGRMGAFWLVPSGANRDDGWQIFDRVREALSLEPIPEAGEKERPELLIVNLTYGFRAQPIFALGAIAFVLSEWARTKTPGVDLQLLYGAYEDRDEETKVVPVWDLTDFALASRWNAALDALMRFGRADDFARLAQTDADEQVKRALTVEGKQGSALEPMSYARKLGDAVRQFAEDLVFLRLKNLFTSSAPALRERLTSKHAAPLVERLPPLRGALRELEDWIEPLCAENVVQLEGLTATKHLVTRYHELQRFSEQMAALEEGLVTAYAHAARVELTKEPGKHGFDTERKRLDDEVGTIVRETQKRLGSNDDTSSVIAQIICARGSTEPTAAQIACIKFLLEVKDLRNDMLHAGLRPHPTKASTLRSKLEGYPRQFLRLEIPPRCFMNLSNHPLARWPAEQLDAARALGLGEPAELTGGLPEVDPELDDVAITSLARDIAQRAADQGAAGAFVATEYALTVALIAELQRRGVRCFAASSRRDVTPLPDDDGAAVRKLAYRFVRFREYPPLALKS